MKKLHLTSFTFTTGENEYTEQRLVVAQTLAEAYFLAKENFANEFPNSDINRIVVHEAIEARKEQKIIDVGMEFFKPDQYPTRTKHGIYSIDVLIDMDGNRADWAIGWFDFDDKEWRFKQEDTSMFDKVNMRWTFLPDQNEHKVN